MVPQAIIREDIMPVLSSFSARVRLDRELGPVFNSIAEDWAEHQQRLEEFWLSLALASGRYKGNPVAMHVIHANRIQPQIFAKWLQLREQTTSEMMSADIARDIQGKAARIADRLNRVMHGPEAVVVARRPSSTEVAKPYRTARIFDREAVPPALLNQHETKDGTGQS
ncbi:hypothetical protein A7J57_00250 [Agrobacterium tumefaciens]|uniref:Group III truncated hemoglobin n=2 Tax=Agrobacterium tumefaciens TaxID=358 RepID=A0A176XH19_AGRTU|nr:hypothetical protein A7J57_00250 [Agrobacterium tumefaciens]